MSGHAEPLQPSADALTASPRLFENALLDRLSRVHWSVPLFVYVPVAGVLLVLALRALPADFVLGAVLLGYLIWTLIEYFGHRFLFHWALPGALGARLHFLIHGVHHVHPNDPLRLVMPVLLSGPIMLVAYGVGRLIFGGTWCLPVLAGFVAGYVSYDMVHFYVHHATPTTRLGMTLRRLHMLHHFRDPARGFGVSAFWWDYVFGTAHDAAARRQSL
jgi:sterol desaturase/sphingolipid hydroxylase (fatty acid hydroxylase superfamily)